MCFFNLDDERPLRSEQRPARDAGPGAWPSGQDGHYRVSDAERDRVAARLRQHATDGRLSFDEFGTRLDECLSATTYDQLRYVLRDLPLLTVQPTGSPRARLGSVFPATVLIAAALIVAIGATLAGHVFPFLPLVPVVAWALIGVWRLRVWRILRAGPRPQALKDRLGFEDLDRV